MYTCLRVAHIYMQSLCYISMSYVHSRMYITSSYISQHFMYAVIVNVLHYHVTHVYFMYAVIVNVTHVYFMYAVIVNVTHVYFMYAVIVNVLHYHVTHIYAISILHHFNSPAFKKRAWLLAVKHPAFKSCPASAILTVTNYYRCTHSYTSNHTRTSQSFISEWRQMFCERFHEGLILSITDII